MTPERTKDLLQQYGVGPIQFSGSNDALYERHLTFDNVVDVKKATVREQFEAAAHAIRDIVSQRWLLTEKTYAEKNPKRVYYLSMEFLLGRSLANNIMNALLQPLAQEAVKKQRSRSAGGVRNGAGCRIGQRRPWQIGRLLH